MNNTLQLLSARKSIHRALPPALPVSLKLTWISIAPTPLVSPSWTAAILLPGRTPSFYSTAPPLSSVCFINEMNLIVSLLPQHLVACGLRNALLEEPEIKLPTSVGSWKKQESSRKTSISALLTMPKSLTVWITINCGKFFKRWEYQTTWPASWEIFMQVRMQQLELDMQKQTGSR